MLGFAAVAEVALDEVPSPPAAALTASGPVAMVGGNSYGSIVQRVVAVPYK